MFVATANNIGDNHTMLILIKASLQLVVNINLNRFLHYKRVSVGFNGPKFY